VLLKIQVYWNATSFRLLKFYRPFRDRNFSVKISWIVFENFVFKVAEKNTLHAFGSSTCVGHDSALFVTASQAVCTEHIGIVGVTA
jgi:hypothetical protein